jgi:hypothetical protein
LQHASALIDKFGLARPVSSKGVLGRDSVKIILEHVLKKNGEESTGGQKETVSDSSGINLTCRQRKRHCTSMSICIVAVVLRSPTQPVI